MQRAAAVRLTQAALNSIRAAGRVSVPSYPRDAVALAAPGIAHLGVGNFFKSHLAANTDALLEQEHATAVNTGDKDSRDSSASALPPQWLIHGVGVMDTPAERAAAEALQAQDGLFGLLTLPGGADRRIVGSLAAFDWLPRAGFDSQQRALGLLRAPTTKIASLTITEKGYCQDADGNLDFDRADVQSDVAIVKALAAGNEAQEKFQTALGLLAAGLVSRHRNEAASITLLSCDNLQHNGKVLRQVVMSFLDEAAPSTADWVGNCESGTRSCAFPNSMVDRITPATTAAFKQRFCEECGVDDAWPVIAEDFTQWVVEEDFIAGRPAWESVERNNVMFVPDVAPFEEMKLRLLNGGHLALAHIATLAGFQTVDAAMTDPSIASYVCSYMESVTHTVPAVPGVDLTEYKAGLLRRFANPDISDQVSRLCEDSSKKFVGWIVPILKEKQRLNDLSHNHEIISNMVAAWIRYSVVVDPSNVADPRAARLAEQALKLDSAVGGNSSSEQQLAEVQHFTTEFLHPTVSTAKLNAEVLSAYTKLKLRGPSAFLTRQDA